LEALGPDEAVKIARLEYENIKVTHSLSRHHGIDCELFSGDTADILYDQMMWNDAIKSIELMRKLMPGDLQGAAKYTLHTSDDASTKFYCKGDKPVGAISYEAGSLVAYKFVIGILKLCLAKGLNLQTSTPVISIEKNDTGEWIVETVRGIVSAKRVVLATNGYTACLAKNLRSVIVPLRGQITAQRPGSNIPKGGLPTTYSFIYHNGYEYMITRPLSSEYAGDIIIGGGLVKTREEGLYEYGTTDDTTLNLEISRYLGETTPRYFGDNWGDDHPDGRIRKQWTGIMGTYNLSRPLARVNPRLHFSVWITTA
jgi:glycine/D-amino acid oxidase-like deaminating enzyme